MILPAFSKLENIVIKVKHYLVSLSERFLLFLEVIYILLKIHV